MRCISLVFVLSDVYFLLFFFFFFNDTATTEIYTLSLHDALPISVVEKDDVAGLLAAEHTPAAQHLFENVAVADGRASQRDVFLGEDALEPKVGHGSSHDAMA